MSALRPLPAAVLVFAAVAFAGPVNAEPTSAQLDDIFSFKGMVYRQSDGGADGNPTIDEDASVYEGLIFIKKQFSPRDALRVRMLGDIVSAASYDSAVDLAETVSQATGWNPGRYDVLLGWDRQVGDMWFGVHGSYGQELAYRTRGAGFNVGRSFNEAATSVGLRMQGYSDMVRVIRFDGAKEQDDRRRTLTSEVTLTQTLTPASLVNFTYTHTRQSGFLATSFNSVLVDGARQVEVLPRDRAREALTVRYKHAVGEGAFEGGYRIYDDDWGVRSQTVDLRFFSYTQGRRVLFEPSYRYYDQDASSHFAVAFDDPLVFMTSDSDLGAFDGHSVGLRTTFLDRSFRGRRGEYDVGVNFYRRGDGLQMYWLTFGVTLGR